MSGHGCLCLSAENWEGRILVAGTRTGDDEKGSVGGLDGLPFLGIGAGGEGIVFGCRLLGGTAHRIPHGITRNAVP